MKRKEKTYRMVLLGILTAIIILQAMLPFLGFIPLGPVSLTIIHVTVIVAAILLGPKDGMIVGLAWGLATMLRAYTAPTTPLDIMIFTNPIVAVLPRVLVGLTAGVTYQWIYKKWQKMSGASIAAAIVGTLTNSILVLTFMGLLYTGPLAAAYGVASSKLAMTLGLLIVTNGIPETLTACVLAPLLVKVLLSATHLPVKS